MIAITGSSSGGGGGTPVKSLAVASSNATPYVGQSITLTTTPTNFTPVSTRFYAQSGTELIYIGLSLTNSIAWTVFAPNGSLDIYAEAVDADGITAWTDIPATITVTGLLLDRFPTATSGFSLDQLSYTFTDNVVMIRRSSDNATDSFGFVSGVLDTASILAFCGAGDGFVVIWYDQSVGANSAFQSIAASQPKIVASGAMVTASDGNPAIDFDGSNDYLGLYNATTMTSGFFAYQLDATGSPILSELFGGKAPMTGQVIAGGSASPGFTVAGATGSAATTVKDLNRHYASGFTASNDGAYVDGSTAVLGAMTPLTNLWYIGSREASTNFMMNGKIQKVISFPDDQWSNKVEIESYL